MYPVYNIWNYNIDKYYLAGVKDLDSIKSGNKKDIDIKGKYINTNIVVFNLKKMRREKMVQVFFDIINTKKLKYPGQDTINIVCTDKEYYLPSIYNCFYRCTYEPVNKELVRAYSYNVLYNEWIINEVYSEEWYEVFEQFNTIYGWDE